MPSRRRVFFLAAIGGLGTAWSYSRRAVRRWEDLDLATVEKPGRLINVNGVELHYTAMGQGPTILLIHGLNGSTFSFRHLAPLLADGYRVLALDLMGFGYSERPPHAEYSLVAQAHLVNGFLDALGIEKAVVLGHSLGGAVAMHLAVMFPERVGRLILVDSASDSETRRGLRSARLARPLLPVVAPFTIQNPRFRRMSLRSGVYDPALITPEVMEGYMTPTRIRGHLRSLGNLMVDRRRDPALDPAAITQPTLIIWGAADRWLPAKHGERLQALIPGSRLVTIEKAGHLVLEEQSEESARVIRDFLREESAPPLALGQSQRG
ncbi:MAG: alpha/beta hydrolase [Dehalococcoidia bacterium]|jgi:pimeloyl-ACP methyl ester carboxylesterase